MRGANGLWDGEDALHTLKHGSHRSSWCWYYRVLFPGEKEVRRKEAIPTTRAEARRPEFTPSLMLSVTVGTGRRLSEPQLPDL